MRYLYNLTAHLPRDAAVARAVNPAAEWTDGEHMLALLAEQVDATNHLLLRAHFEPTGREPTLLRIRRPGEQETPEPEPVKPFHLSSPSQVKSFFGEGIEYVPPAAAPATTDEIDTFFGDFFSDE